jgi:hypothetical protein
MVVADGRPRIGAPADSRNVEGNEAGQGHYESEDCVHLGTSLRNLSWEVDQLLEYVLLRVTCQVL